MLRDLAQWFSVETLGGSVNCSCHHVPHVFSTCFLVPSVLAPWAKSNQNFKFTMQNGIFVRSYLMKLANPWDFSSPKFNSCTKKENMVNSKTNSARKPCQLAQLSMRPCFRGIFGAVDRPDLSKVRLRVAAISLVILFLLPMAIPPIYSLHVCICIYIYILYTHG